MSKFPSNLNISLIIRRMHLFLALFFIPWMLIYAFSAITLNHREYFNRFLPQGQEWFSKEYEIIYDGTFPDDAGPRMKAEQILSDSGLDGAFGIQENKNRGILTIWRNDPLNPRRLIYTYDDNKLLVERGKFRTVPFMRQMHFRRGYGQKYFMNNLWAFVIDIVIFSIIFWGISGVWMWWKMKALRKWGAVFTAAGIGLFLIFLFTI